MEWISFVSLSVLVAGIIDDLRSRKIHNKLLLVLLFISVLSSFIAHGFWGFFQVSLPSFALAFLIGCPFYFLKMIGGGDFKLLCVVSWTWGLEELFWSFVLSFPIAVLFGLFTVLIKRKIKSFLKNILSLLKREKVNRAKLQTFPYSVVLLLGWMSFRVIKESHLLPIMF